MQLAIKISRKENIELFANFQLAQSDTFQKNLLKNLGPQAEKIYALLASETFDQLVKNPYYGPNVKKLRDQNPPKWRYRWGNYRLIYRVDPDQKLIILISLRHRKDAYK